MPPRRKAYEQETQYAAGLLPALGGAAVAGGGGFWAHRAYLKKMRRENRFFDQPREAPEASTAQYRAQAQQALVNLQDCKTYSGELKDAGKKLTTRLKAIDFLTKFALKPTPQTKKVALDYIKTNRTVLVSQELTPKIYQAFVNSQQSQFFHKNALEICQRLSRNL